MEENKKTKFYLDAIKESLSQLLGIEKTDIQTEDSFKEDLHMGPAEITDFIQLMSKKGINIDNFDTEEIETVGDFVDFLMANEEI